MTGVQTCALPISDEDVVDAYTDAYAGRTVFAGGPDWDVDVVCDLRVGGVRSIRSAPPDGAAYRETNRFTVVDRPRRLAFESALTMPDGSTVRRDVDVTFRNEERGRTRMTIVQKGSPPRRHGTRSARAFPASLTGSSALPRRGPFVGNRGPRGGARRHAEAASMRGSLE